jgi:hypothetical protein
MKAYVVAGLGLPELDVLSSQCFDVAGLVNYAGARGASADVDADVVVLQVREQVSSCACRVGEAIGRIGLAGKHTKASCCLSIVK